MASEKKWVDPVPNGATFPPTVAGDAVEPVALTIHVYGAEQMGLSFSGPSIPFAISGLPGKVSGKQGQLKFQIEFYPEKPGLYTDAVVIRLDGEIVYILPVAGYVQESPAA